VADATPEWANTNLVLPLHAADYTMQNLSEYPSNVLARYEKFKAVRNNFVYYDEKLRSAKHIHIPGDTPHRLLMHHYAFVFCANQEMQKFYRRFVRDFIRYKDEIHCVGHDLIQAIRQDSLKHNPGGRGEFYALHIRRGDFQFKNVKLSAGEILSNLHFANGQPIIPAGSFVYIATDDPDGLCKDCLVNRKPCAEYETPKPVGCPEDVGTIFHLE
jgi:hypothetical protein